MPFLESALEAAGRITVFTEVDGVVNDGENGEDPQFEEVQGSSLLPNSVQRRASRQFETIAQPMHEATQKMQGLTATADETYVLVWRLHRFYDDPPESHQVKQPATGDGEPPFVTVLQRDLDESVKLFQAIAASELHKRFIAPGPSKNQLICMYLNPTMRASKHEKYLTASQITSMNVHVSCALREQASLRPASQSSSSSSSASSSSSSPSCSSPRLSTSSSQAAASVLDESDDEELSAPSAELPSTVEAWLAEKRAYDEPTDFSAGLCSKGRFRAVVFWANPEIIAKFPLLSAVARSQFSGLPHEATSERTFSFSGRTCSKLRTSMGIDQVCAHVLANSGLKHHSGSVAEVRARYETKSAASKRKAAEAGVKDIGTGFRSEVNYKYGAYTIYQTAL